VLAPWRGARSAPAARMDGGADREIYGREGRCRGSGAWRNSVRYRALGGAHGLSCRATRFSHEDCRFQQADNVRHGRLRIVSRQSSKCLTILR